MYVSAIYIHLHIVRICICLYYILSVHISYGASCTHLYLVAPHICIFVMYMLRIWILGQGAALEMPWGFFFTWQDVHVLQLQAATTNKETCWNDFASSPMGPRAWFLFVEGTHFGWVESGLKGGRPEGKRQLGSKSFEQKHHQHICVFLANKISGYKGVYLWPMPFAGEAFISGLAMILFVVILGLDHAQQVVRMFLFLVKQGQILIHRLRVLGQVQQVSNVDVITQARALTSWLLTAVLRIFGRWLVLTMIHSP